MKPRLAIVTGNALKFRQLSARLGEFFECEQKVLEGYFEVQGTPEEILRHKLHAAYDAFHEAVLVDDTSVHFDALGGFPGPYIKDFIRAIPVYDMGVKFAGTRMSVVCRLGIYDGKGEPIIGTGIVSGDVVMPKNIDPGNREFDLFFKIDETDKPLIDFTPEETNAFSHRGQALDNLIAQLGK